MIMKRSTALFYLAIASAIVYFATDSEIKKIIISITSSIFVTGYFIVKELEEHKKWKNNLNTGVIFPNKKNAS